MRNAIVDQILMERMNRRGGYDGRDYARGDYGRGGYDGRGGNYDEERFEDEDEKYLMEMQDGRLRIKAHLTSSIYGKIEDTWDCSDYFVDCFWLVQ